MSALPRYALLGGLDWRELDGEWVVFCSASGALAAVDAVGAALLALLEDGPACAAELTSRLAEVAGGAVPSDAAIGVAARLRQWQQDGLLEPLDV